MPDIPEVNSSGNDVNAYRALFDALGEEPVKGLPYNFASKVTRHIQADEKLSNELKYNFAAFLIFIAALGGLYSLLVYFTPDQASSLLNYKCVLLLFPIVFIAIQYFDQRLIKTRIFRNKTNT